VRICSKVSASSAVLIHTSTPDIAGLDHWFGGGA
jgi:hypothetical protein